MKDNSSPHCPVPRQINKPLSYYGMKGAVLLGNVFDEIRNRVSMQDVAKFYGLQMSHSNMVCCPFHDDSKPSLKIYDDHFYCFGCGATGDCTGFAAKLFGIPQIEAAKKISYDFGLNLFNGEIAVPVNPRLKSENDFHIWLRNANLAVSEYYKKLREWREAYSPHNQWEQLHPLFVESLKKLDYVEYLADFFAYSSDREKKLFYKENGTDIIKIQERLKKLAVEAHTVKRKAI